MNKNYTLKELADIGAVAANLDYVLGKIAREAFTKAILDTIGYEFPKDEEKEAFDAWYQSAQIPQGETQAFAAWKAGREELRRAQMTEKEQDKSEFPNPPASGMKVCYWKDMPKDSNPYGKSMWAFGGWVGLYRDSNPAPDTIVAYLPEPKVKDEFLTAEYKTEPAWIPWAGGDCPLADTVKRWEYRMRNGKAITVTDPGRRDEYWSNEGLPGDIVAYRVWEG